MDLNKPYKCSQCTYASVSKGHLNSHMRTHTGEKPHKCSQCSFSCAQPGNLNSHMRTHTGEKPHKCSQCSYACAQPGSLKRHMRTHTGEKPYKCTQCSYASTHLGGLQAHMRTHTDEKPHKCKMCSYATANNDDLKMHMRTHTGEKPYKCMQCSYASVGSGHLKRHMLVHAESFSARAHLKMQAAVVTGARLVPDPVLLQCPICRAQVISPMNRRARASPGSCASCSRNVSAGFRAAFFIRSFKLEAVEGSWEICVILRIEPLGRSPHIEVALICWSEGHPKGFDHSMLLRITQGQHNRTLRLWLL